jgi:hypothetical protein
MKQRTFILIFALATTVTVVALVVYAMHSSDQQLAAGPCDPSISLCL